MESRGYGIGKRTSFHRFRWHICDIIVIVTIIPIIILIFVSILNGGFGVDFFPEININQFSLYEKVLAVVYGVYAVMPLLIEFFNINTYGG